MDKKLEMAGIAARIGAEYEDFLHCIYTDDNAPKLVLRLRILLEEGGKGGEEGGEATDETLKKLDAMYLRDLKLQVGCVRRENQRQCFEAFAVLRVLLCTLFHVCCLAPCVTLDALYPRDLKLQARVSGACVNCRDSGATGGHASFGSVWVFRSSWTTRGVVALRTCSCTALRSGHQTLTPAWRVFSHLRAFPASRRCRCATASASSRTAPRTLGSPPSTTTGRWTRRGSTSCRRVAYIFLLRITCVDASCPGGHQARAGVRHALCLSPRITTV